MHANQNINRKRRTGERGRRGEKEKERVQHEIESAKNKAKINYLTMQTKQKTGTRQKEQ